MITSSQSLMKRNEDEKLNSGNVLNPVMRDNKGRHVPGDDKRRHS